MSELKPCPNPSCNNEQLPVVDFNDDEMETISGICVCCGVQGPEIHCTINAEDRFIAEASEHAARLWNLLPRIDPAKGEG